MSTYQGFSATDWARPLHTTLTKHITEVEENMLRNFQFGALLEANGRVMYNHGGRGIDWPVQFKLHEVEGNTGTTSRNFSQVNLWQTANLPYRGYQATDAMYYKEFRENMGPEGIVKVFNGLVSRLETSLKQHFGTQYYVDGNATGNEQSWHGFESMYGINSSLETINVDGTGARAANQADFVANPSDTYAGLSTALGGISGEQESGVPWPHGVATSDYDFWSPLIITFDSSAFGATDDTFDAGDEAMRYGIIHAQRNSSLDGQITQVMLDRELYRQFLDVIDDKEQIQIDSASQGSLRSLGFRNNVIFDGVEVTWEAGVPNRVGYGCNINGIELVSMDDSLLRAEGPEYDIDDQAFKVVVSTLSNLCFKSGPRNTFKLVEYDTVSAA